MTREHTHCTFCDLIHGAAEVSICHEDADSIAFMDIQPVNNGHVLVAPRQHYDSLADVPEDLGVHLFKVTMRLAGAVRTVSACDALNIVVNSGAEAGQDEPHYHIHIIPRREGDGFAIPLPFDGSQMPDRTILDAYAARIIAALSDPTALADGVVDEAFGGDRARPVPAYRETPARSPASDALHAMRPSRARGAPADRLEISEGAHGELRYGPEGDVDGRA